MAQDFCELVTSNTGLPVCDVKLGKPIAAFFANKSVEITPQDQNDLLAFFQSKTQVDDFQKRVLPVTGMKQIDDGYTAPTEGTLAGYGYSEQLGDGVMKSTIHFPTSLCRAKSLYGLNGYNGRVFVLLDNGVLVGTRLSNGNIIGLPLENLGVQVTGGLFGDGANVKTVQLILTFGSDKEMIKNMAAIKYNFNVDEVIGLQNVVLEKVSELSYQVVAECGRANLYDAYKGDLASAALWLVSNTQTGSPIVLTTVTAVDSSKSFTLTPGTALTKPYKINIQLAPVSELESAGVVGFEQPAPFIDDVKV